MSIYKAHIEFEEKYIKANGINIHYVESGTGDAMIFLHGGGANYQAWNMVAGNGITPNGLKDNYRVLILDTIGHGLSGDDERPFTYKLFADDVNAYMEVLNIENSYIVGHSDGGCTTLEMILHYPERIKKFIVLGTPYHTDNYWPGMVNLFKDAADKPITNKSPPEEKFHVKLMKMWANYPKMVLEQLSSNKKPGLIIHAQR
jgi:pimeloyl-ACP methyl ester carboxylesterase